MLELVTINNQNYEEIIALRVAEAQRDYVAGNDISLIEAYIALSHGGHAFPFGLYDNGIPVGFLMIGYGVDEDWKNAPDVARDNYSLWRLMIDERYQQRGYGSQAMALALSFLRSEPCGKAACCWVSYDPENRTAARLYAKYGFAETDEYDGNEVIAVKPL